jgi:hypothetical protein
VSRHHESTPSEPHSVGDNHLHRSYDRNNTDNSLAFRRQASGCCVVSVVSVAPTARAFINIPMPTTYLGWNVITMPTTPVAPKSFEFQPNPLVAVNTNPFTGQQQIQAWGAPFLKGSVSYAPMKFATAQPWVTFLNDLQGMTNVFQFPTSTTSLYPLELTSDGTTPQYFRLSTNDSKWSIQEGSIYSFTFEFRLAI